MDQAYTSYVGNTLSPNVLFYDPSDGQWTQGIAHQSPDQSTVIWLTNTGTNTCTIIALVGQPALQVWPGGLQVGVQTAIV